MDRSTELQKQEFRPTSISNIKVAFIIDTSLRINRVTSGTYCIPVAYPGILFEGGGVSQIQLGAEGRQKRDPGAVAPQHGVPRPP